MESTFLLILEDFKAELFAIRTLVEASSANHLPSPKARIAGANAATLLLAATFEEFIREAARAFAKRVVEKSKSFDDLPPKIAETVWKRTMERLAKLHLNPNKNVFSRESIFSDALTKFMLTYQFCCGDLSKDIYNDLIHNEMNMRPQQINELLKISGLNNVCGVACADPVLISFLNETEPGKAHTLFIRLLEEFFERRNQVAHSLNSLKSNGPEQIFQDIELLTQFGTALCAALENH